MEILSVSLCDGSAVSQLAEVKMKRNNNNDFKKSAIWGKACTEEQKRTSSRQWRSVNQWTLHFSAKMQNQGNLWKHQGQSFESHLPPNSAIFSWIFLMVTLFLLISQHSCMSFFLFWSKWLLVNVLIRGCSDVISVISAARGSVRRTRHVLAFTLSSILHQNNRPNTSNLWLLTLFPFLFHTILGRGSPVAWQMKEATPPWTPVWSLGVLKNFGGAGKKKRKPQKEKNVLRASFRLPVPTYRAFQPGFCCFQHFTVIVKRIILCSPTNNGTRFGSRTEWLTRKKTQKPNEKKEDVIDWTIRHIIPLICRRKTMTADVTLSGL